MSEPLTAERLREIRERCEMATPGPWVWLDAYMMRHENPKVGEPFDERARIYDRHFIACARQDVPDLLAEVDRLRAALVAIHEQADTTARVWERAAVDTEEALHFVRWLRQETAPFSVDAPQPPA